MCALQAIKAKMIAEGRLLGPKNKQSMQAEAVKYEPYDTPDGKF